MQSRHVGVGSCDHIKWGCGHIRWVCSHVITSDGGVVMWSHQVEVEHVVTSDQG